MPEVKRRTVVFPSCRAFVLREGSAVLPRQRAAAVLSVLVERPGRVVPKAELMARVWPAVIVGEGNLTVRIAFLRKALGERPDGRSWIGIVPRVGYRMIAGDVGSDSAELDLPNPPSLAVLPFRVSPEGRRPYSVLWSSGSHGWHRRGTCGARSAGGSRIADSCNDRQLAMVPATVSEAVR